jgi:hypothetical protein
MPLASRNETQIPIWDDWRGQIMPREGGKTSFQTAQTNDAQWFVTIAPIFLGSLAPALLTNNRQKGRAGCACWCLAEGDQQTQRGPMEKF